METKETLSHTATRRADMMTASQTKKMHGKKMFAGMTPVHVMNWGVGKSEGKVKIRVQRLAIGKGAYSTFRVNTDRITWIDAGILTKKQDETAVDERGICKSGLWG